MSTETVIREKLVQAFRPEHLEVVNESANHRVPAGAETHFKVVLVSTLFDGERPVARHRRVHAVLANELAGGVHALALHTYTASEWQRKAASAPASPACAGQRAAP